MSAATHYWCWRKWLPERRRQPCRVLARGKLGSVLIQFCDGRQVVTSRWAVRRLPVGGEEPRPNNR